ncbi:MAG: hypothetical protein EXQ53_09570 [Acidobacteria bacterium]|nr:hypothetical protein [Acidobacteriota bacterium]
MADLRNVVADVRSDMSTRFAEMSRQFTELRGGMNGRFKDVNRRIGALDAKVDRHFVWLMGMMATGFITVIGALVGIVYR